MFKNKLFLTAVFIAFSSIVLHAGTFPIVHAYRSGAAGIYSNAYIIELQQGLVVVDATLTVSSAREVRGIIDDLSKPIYAILITHGHPDHYNGLTEITTGLNVPVYSTAGVLEVIKKYDAEKDKQWRPMFGDEWPLKRTFPDKTIRNGETLKFENISFTVFDIGAGESHSDAYWVMENNNIQQAFIGDIVLYKVHAYLSDGHVSEWLQHLQELKRTLKDMIILYPGHGLAGGVEMLDWQKQYIEHYLENLKPLWADKKISDEEKAQLTARMKEFLPNDKLVFLVGLGAEAAGRSAFK
jgi:glyoxylase-like metal-dependent hydrolase (beta-lactamase superfamily II)